VLNVESKPELTLERRTRPQRRREADQFIQPKTDQASNPIGIAILVIGVLMLCFSFCCGMFSLSMDTTVPTDDGGRVGNLPLMHQQQIYVISSIGVGVIGVGLLGTGALLWSSSRNK
jgi:hypothetical protein